MLKTVGRQAEGIAAYRKAIALKPTLGEAWWSLANLKTVRFDEDDIAAMRGGARAPDLKDEDRFHLDFALGKAMHDAGRARRGVRAIIAAGNALRREIPPVPPGEVDPAGRSQHRDCSPPKCSARPGGCEAPDPIFIVGMPRAGSTLVEQILSSHSLVEGTSELPDIPALARQGAALSRRSGRR